MVKNPWEEISLDDYENHMKLDSVQQLQTMNTMMKEQFFQYPVKSIMVLGIAGGNGLEHINSQFEKVYGVDINREYLEECRKRYPKLEGILELLCVDLMTDIQQLVHADLVVANLLVEYIGYECFQKVILKVKPQYASCIIQINTDSSFVSDSPYLHVFDYLDRVHHQMEEQPLIDAMKNIGYQVELQGEEPLPNGKKLVRLDFQKSSRF